MKWNGIVSQRSHRIIATRFAIAKRTQATSTFRRLRMSRALCGKPVSRVAHRLDRRVRPKLLAEAADADVDDIRAGVEVVAPDVREEPLTAHHLARVQHELVEQLELPVRQVGDDATEPHLPAG